LTSQVTTELERDPLYVVRSAAFEGPIELLLTLAQRAEVDLKTIAIGRSTRSARRLTGSPPSS